MKKMKKLKPVDVGKVQNPVAKFAHQFNKAQIYQDKTKYQRRSKHKGKEPFPMLFLTVLEKVSSLAYYTRSEC